MFEPSYVLRQIDLLLAYGIHDIEFTGGEPSECKHLREYCEYVKAKSSTSKIAVITNGGLWTSDVWDLIDEVLVSYHLSKDDAAYDKMLFPHGCTFNKVEKTVQKAHQLGKIVRTNTVLGSFNNKSLDLIVNDLISLKPSIVNFLPVNLFDGARNMESYINYSMLRPALKNAIDKIESALPGVLVLIRYMPFCEMNGYEHHILGTLHHMFDWFDWNIELSGQYLLSYLEKFATNEEALAWLGKYGSRSFDIARDCIHHNYEKSSKCIGCKYYMICDGVEKTHDHRLLDCIVPTKGEPIKNFMQYIGTSISDFYRKRYNIIV